MCCQFHCFAAVFSLASRLGISLLVALAMELAMTFWLGDSNVWSSIVLAIMAIILIRGIQAFYQDFSTYRTTREEQPDRQQQQNAVPPPVPNAVPPPVPPPMAHQEQPQVAPPNPPPLIVRHYETRIKYAAKIWHSTDGPKYHIYSDCHHIKGKASTKNKTLCSQCEKIASERNTTTEDVVVES